MGIFSRVAQTKRRTTVVVIDIGSASVAGAYVCLSAENEPVTLYYSARVPLTKHKDESLEAAMHRALTTLALLLVEQGAPIVRQIVGNAHVQSVLVSITAPWQDTQVSLERSLETKPFRYTHEREVEMVTQGRHLKPGYRLTSEAVLATFLNGYPVDMPLGKEVRRAEIVLFTASVDDKVATDVERELRRAFHTSNITLTAFAPVSYSILSSLYPHEKDYLVLRVSGAGTSTIFVKRGTLREAGATTQGTNDLIEAVHAARLQTPTLPAVDVSTPNRNAQFAETVGAKEEEWLTTIANVLREFAGRHALPRTIFLLADDDSREFLAHLLDHPKLHELWLSDEPLGIIPVLSEQFTDHVHLVADAKPDIFLELLALYARQGSKNVIPTKRSVSP